jgi:hypothetical protein
MARKLLAQSDPAEVQARLCATLSILHPDRTDFTLPEVMKALHVMGELSAPVRSKAV